MTQYDHEGSRPLARTSATGKVKWFNGTKGYGFVTLDGGSDAFCHASALQALGHSEVPQGTTIVCDLADSPRGLQVVNIHSVDLSTAEAAAPQRAAPRLWRRPWRLPGQRPLRSHGGRQDQVLQRSEGLRFCDAGFRLRATSICMPARSGGRACRRSNRTSASAIPPARASRAWKSTGSSSSKQGRGLRFRGIRQMAFKPARPWRCPAPRPGRSPLP